MGCACELFSHFGQKASEGFLLWLNIDIANGMGAFLSVEHLLPGNNLKRKVNIIMFVITEHKNKSIVV